MSVRLGARIRRAERLLAAHRRHADQGIHPAAARPRLVCAMIIMIPLVQLMLFGYAINTNPRHLPTAVLLQETSDLGRSILKALQNTAYFEFTRAMRDEAEFDQAAGFRHGSVRHRDTGGFRARGAARRSSGAAGRRRCDRSGGGRLRHSGARSSSTPRSSTIATSPTPAAAVRDPHPCPLQSGRHRRRSTSCPGWSAPSSP